MNNTLILITIYLLIFLAGSSCGIIDQLIVENEEYEMQYNPIIEEDSEYKNLNWEVKNGYYMVPDFPQDKDTLIHIINNRVDNLTPLVSRIIKRSSEFHCLENVRINIKFSVDLIINNKGDILAIKPIDFPLKIIDLNCYIFEQSKTKFESTKNNTYSKGTYTYGIDVMNN